MKTAPRLELEQNSRDRELEEILRLAEGGIDEETKRFVDEVLKFAPIEPQLEIQIFTSHRGAGDAR